MDSTSYMMRILFAGEGWTTLQLNLKGFDVFQLGSYQDFGKFLRESLSRFNDVEVVHMPNYIAFREFPKTVEELRQFDVVILSDIGSNTLVLYPDLFKIPMGPNRLKTIRDYVKSGGGLIMAGGWNSFAGELGIAKYHGTPVEEALPVKISWWDDRVETPEGVSPKILKPQHEILQGISLEWPLFLGYNRVKLKSNAELLATINEDPFIAVWEFGEGRAMAFTSDLAPHWGTAFIKWDYYSQFWYQSVRWLARK